MPGFYLHELSREGHLKDDEYFHLRILFFDLTVFSLRRGNPEDACFHEGHLREGDQEKMNDVDDVIEEGGTTFYRRKTL